MSHLSDVNVIKRSKLTNRYIFDISNFGAYFFTVILIYLTGVPGFNNEYLILVMFAISLITFLNKGLKFDREILYVLLLLFVMTIFQVMEFAFFSLWTNSGVFVRFVFAYLAIRIIGYNFPLYYVRVMYIITIISLIFYLPSIIMPGFIDLLSQIADLIGTVGFGRGENIIIYSAQRVLRYGLLRNSGPFGEPGMFSVYLTIALIFNTILTKKLNEKKNVVFIFALITTLSTAGYLVLMLYFISYLVLGGFKKPAVILLLPFLLYGSWYIYFNVDFMGDKIDSQFEGVYRGEVYAGRIGSAAKDFQDIIKHPLFGRGRHQETRHDYYIESNELHISRRFHRTNGVTDFIVRYGLIFSLFYFYHIYKSLLVICKINNFSKYFALMSFLLILTVGFSQVIFQHFILIGLIFLHTNYKYNNLINYDGKIANI